MDWIMVPDGRAPLSLYLLAGFVAVMLIAVSKGGFGSGLGMLSVPVMMQVAPGAQVLPMMLPVLIWCDLLAIRHYSGQWRPRAVWLVAPGALAGIVIGWLLLGWLGEAKVSDTLAVKVSDTFSSRARNEAWLKLVTGAICLGFVGVWAAGQRLGRRAEERAPWRPTWLGATAAGLPSGITTMLAHAAGPIITMYLLPQKLDKREFVGTTVRYFFTFNLVKVPFFMALKGEARLDWPIFRATLWMLALAPLGVWLGSWLNHKLQPRHFSRIIYACLAAAGAKLLWDALRVLLG